MNKERIIKTVIEREEFNQQIYKKPLEVEPIILVKDAIQRALIIAGKELTG